MPVLTAGGDVVVPDSEAILRWAEKTRGANLYPTAQCAEWSERASDGFLPNAVLYYNWIEPEGYARSMRAKFASFVPWYAGGGTCIAGYLVDWGTAKKRAEFAEKVLPELSKHPDVGTLEGRADAVAKEHVIREALVKELMHFQSGLANSAPPVPVAERGASGHGTARVAKRLREAGGAPWGTRRFPRPCRVCWTTLGSGRLRSGGR